MTKSLTDRLAAALRDARGFIRNGIEFGYIRMPDKDVPDTAHDTLPHIETALAAYDAARQRPEAGFDEAAERLIAEKAWLNSQGTGWFCHMGGQLRERLARDPSRCHTESACRAWRGDVSFDLNASMIVVARQRAEQLAKELQADAVVTVIAHSGSLIAIGYAHAESETTNSVRQILREAYDGFYASAAGEET